MKYSNALFAAIVSICFLIGLIIAAWARPPAGIPIDPALHQWFESLQQPGSGMSCCGNADGHILDGKDVRTTRNGYEIRINGQWIPVPNNVILQRTDNPTGQFVYFATPYWPDHIYCFVTPPMT